MLVWQHARTDAPFGADLAYCPCRAHLRRHAAQVCTLANVRTNPAVSLSLADTSNALIVEGTAQPAPERRAELQPLFQAKYNWDIATDPTTTMYSR